MRRFSISGRTAARRLSSFTLVELLVVMAIIGILAALTLAGASAVMNAAGRNRAKGEIQAMSAALESYKTDNGIYPVGAVTVGSGSILTGPPSGNYATDPSVSGGTYQTASQALYEALSGQTNYLDNTSLGKAYMTFKTGQLGNYKTAANSGYSAASTYVSDPFGYAYGYSTGDNQSPQVLYPFNGSGFFDLWSTGGLTQTTSAHQNPTNSWISNWN
jgi:prepilin-type N-terminal cleavage/methylation domain-containing protein